jgi:hypothetical protein
MRTVRRNSFLAPIGARVAAPIGLSLPTLGQLLVAARDRPLVAAGTATPRLTHCSMHNRRHRDNGRERAAELAAGWNP